MRAYVPCLCCSEPWPEDMVTPTVGDDLMGQLCPRCRQHSGKWAAEIKVLREQIKELREQAEFQRKLRASA